MPVAFSNGTVSWLLRDTNKVGKVVLSSRGNCSRPKLIDYIENKLLNYEFNEIANRFTKIGSKTAISWDMLQLADIYLQLHVLLS